MIPDRLSSSQSGASLRFKVAITDEALVACPAVLIHPLNDALLFHGGEMTVLSYEDIMRNQRVLEGEVHGPIGHLWLRGVTALARMDWDMLGRTVRELQSSTGEPASSA